MASNRDSNHIGNFVTFGQFLSSFINNSIPSANIPASFHYIQQNALDFVQQDGISFFLEN